MTPLTLASKSAARAAILTGAGVVFDTVDAGADEAAAKRTLLEHDATPDTVAMALAQLKAVPLSRRLPGLVIGADQTLNFDGELVDKAESLEEARARLRMLRGKTHRLHSAVTLAENGQVVWQEIPTATLTMRAVSDAFIDAYLERHGEGILASVGCYRLEDDGVQLFDRIEGDYFTILGLPLLGLLRELRNRGALAI